MDSSTRTKRFLLNIPEEVKKVSVTTKTQISVPFCPLFWRNTTVPLSVDISNKQVASNISLLYIEAPSSNVTVIFAKVRWR